MKKSYDAYLFDVDGTLLDTTEMIYQCFLHTCKKFANIHVTREKIFGSIGIPLRPQLDNLLGPMTDEEAERISRSHMDYQVSIYKDHLTIFPGVFEGLEALRKNGKKLAVVTSRRMASLELYLKYTGIMDFFDVVITPESTQKHKPDPEPALAAASGLGILPENCIMIGDAVFDIDCGNRAGMDTAFIGWSQNDASALPTAPTYLIKNLQDLY